MKKSKFLLLTGLLFISTASLASCNFIKDIIDSIPDDDGNDNDGGNNIVLDNGAKVNVSVGNYINTSENVLKPNDYEVTINQNEAVNYGIYNISYIPSVGDANILVLPIDLSSLVSNTPYKATSTNKDTISKAFFGDPSDSTIYYESVASFYEKSSYNKLHIKGDVANWYDVTKSGYRTLASIKDENEVIKIMNDAISYLKIDTSKYDANKDGIIDGVWMIYNYYDYSTASERGITISNNYWAYTYWDQDEKTPSTSKPVSNVFAWASIDFLFEAGNNKIDSHTLIHETGHMLGLSDYYDTSYNTSPLGMVDMMDANIIDHNFYSKMILGWVKPYIVTGDCDITLSKTNVENNFIIVPYNGLNIRTTGNKKYFNVFDEYMLVEYYTPTGLNKCDSDKKYPGNNVQGFTTEGYRVYHVDARKWYIHYQNRKYNVKYYNNEQLDYDYDALVTATTNSSKDGVESESTIYSDIKTLDNKIVFDSNCSVSDYYNEIMLIDKKDRYNSYEAPYVNGYNALAVADNNCLFKSNDVFTLKGYEKAFIDGKFSNKKGFNSSIVFK